MSIYSIGMASRFSLFFFCLAGNGKTQALKPQGLRGSGVVMDPWMHQCISIKHWGLPIRPRTPPEQEARNVMPSEVSPQEAFERQAGAILAPRGGPPQLGRQCGTKSPPV